ncbi:MAG: 3-hydroxybutyryl-CoA dehydrogenase [Thermoleophilaceae bacterium]|nr:3-hydroxybutyryl-CoA dehydrogenase [Thermoleophilaceae bacterium]
MTRLGVVGAGTMGADIAQLGALAGMETWLHDPVPEALEKGTEAAHRNIDKGAERGRWTSDDATAAHELLRPADGLGALADCDFVIEAAPERFDLKRELFQELRETCGDDAVLASNTSSIPITRIAGTVRAPENVAGLHFFNPAPLMKLVEAIPALQTSEATLQRTVEVGEAMGKHVIKAADGPGFLVNRCGRPFGSEALRILQERLATVEEIDAIYRDGGGYRMGPFELMDLVGIDVGLAVAQSFTELSFGEPRWKPNPLQARMVAAGRLGRKTGRGWYEYGDEAQRGVTPEGSDPPRNASALLDRVQCCIVNEAIFALGEGVGSAEDIDTGAKLGLNWPKGPLELGRELGFDHVLATMDGLYERYHEERYRAAPLLRDGDLD